MLNFTLRPRDRGGRRSEHEAPAMQLAKYVKFREEKFGGVLFETRSEKVFTLNPTATAVVREIQAGGDEAAIAARLRDRFDDRAGAIERDVLALIEDLRQRGLIEG
jgi:PqqD family protein of HPr-rel-A system